MTHSDTESGISGWSDVCEISETTDVNDPDPEVYFKDPNSVELHDHNQGITDEQW